MAEGTIKVILDPDTRKLDRALKGKRIGVGGGGETASQKKQQKESTILTGLTKRVLATVASIALILTALDFILKPMAALLTAILTLLFLPLIPLFKPALKALADFLPLMFKISEGLTKLVQFLVDMLIAGLDAVIKVIVFLGKLIGAGLDAIKAGILFLGKIIVGVIKGIFKGVSNIGKFLLEEIIKPGFSFLLKVGTLLWEEIIRPGFLFLKDVGQKAWDIMKSAFVFIKDSLVRGIKGAINAIISVVNKLPFVNVPRLAAGGIVTRPTLAVVGEGGPEAIIPLNQARGFGGNVTINFNNPIVREERDLKKIADQISRVMAKGKLRGFAPGV